MLDEIPLSFWGYRVPWVGFNISGLAMKIQHQVQVLAKLRPSPHFGH